MPENEEEEITEAELESRAKDLDRRRENLDKREEKLDAREAKLEERAAELDILAESMTTREKAATKIQEGGAAVEPEPLPEELVSQMTTMIRAWGQRGAPEKASQLRRHLATQTKPPTELLTTGPIKPEKSVENVEDLEIPPRAGKGSTKAAWAEFALTVSDIEEEVVERMSRDDIVAMLQAKKVIPQDDE